MRLNVELRDDLFFRLRAAAEGAPDAVTLSGRVLEIVGADEAFAPVLPLVSEDPEDWFALDRMSLEDGFWPAQEELVRSLTARRDESVDVLLPYLPRDPRAEEASLSIVLTPGFHRCFGPSAGVQIFGLREAEPEEAFLFLVHVYYHELTSLYASDWSKRCETPTSAADLKHWLLLLVQNEGLANYAVLEPVLALREREPRPELAYFTYARLIGDAEATATAMQMLRRLLRELDETSWRLFQPHVAVLLKDERLPVINLVGIHLAEAIARRLGTERLLDRREPEEFFELFAELDDPLRGALFGDDGSDLELFQLQDPSGS
jgi:hypothetical protein